MAMVSACSLAMFLGVTSPTSRITTVMTSVETVTPLLPSARTNSTVASEDARMLTMLLPIRIDESRLS